MYKDQIIKVLSEVTGVDQPHLEHTQNLDHGDYASNVAMQQAKSLGKNPRELAEEYVKLLSESLPAQAGNSLMSIVSKVEVAGPGFINFYLSEEALSDTLKTVLEQGDHFGKSESNKGKKVTFEYGQPNTHKLPHIGHLFSYIFGESVARIMEATGWEVRRVNYQGDIGPQVAKALWAFQKNNPAVPDSLEEKANLLQEMYQIGSKAYEEDPEAKNEINELNKAIYLGQDKAVEKLWKETRQWSLDYYQEFEKRLGVSYQQYYFESEIYSKGMEIVKNNSSVFATGDEGAIIFPGSKYGLHDRVFITKFGTPTYEAKDMALQNIKMQDFPCDLLVIATASEQNAYFDVVFKALELVDASFERKLKHIGFGMVNLKTGKMSSRTGNIIRGIDLVNMTVDAVKELSEEDNEEIAEVVGIGAVKYSFLKSNPLQNITFSFEESIAKEGNSGPYLQYTYARTQSVLGKSDKKTGAHHENIGQDEQEIVRQLARFSEIIVNASNLYSPNLIANYLFELSQLYNAFYNNNRIIGSEQEQARIELTKAVGIVLRNGLNLLGIDSPSKM